MDNSDTLSLRRPNVLDNGRATVLQEWSIDKSRNTLGDIMKIDVLLCVVGHHSVIEISNLVFRQKQCVVIRGGTHVRDSGRLRRC